MAYQPKLDAAAYIAGYTGMNPKRSGELAGYLGAMNVFSTMQQQQQQQTQQKGN